MLNAEKYKDEILRTAMSDFTKKNTYSPYCYALGTVSKKTTTEEAVEWLLSEYEPPLLENGDGLKTGDWIMVSNDKNVWKNRQFLYFWKDCFYAANVSTSPEQGEAVKWNYARLPEEGD